MRRTTPAVLLLSVLTLAGIAPPAVAAPNTVVRSYVGTTSAGGTIRLFTSVRDGVVRFQAVGLEDVAACEDSSTLAFAHGVDHSPRGVAMDGSAVETESIFFSDAFFLSATIGTRVATGTIEHLFAALDAREDAQLCTTGELTFTAVREYITAPVAASTLLVMEGRSGASFARLGSVEGDRAPARERLRTYDGRTSGRYRIGLTTARTATAVELRELVFAWHLACEDATSSVDLGFFILFGGEVLEDDRIAYGPAAPEIALHIDGRLGAHAGSGTTSLTIPALTEDLQAQACRSGDQTWRAWRIDEGAMPV